MRINVERQDLKDWIAQLKGASRGDYYAGLWRRVLYLSAVPARARKSVNLYKINKYSAEGDNIVVPGKVLSEGHLDHRITITAMEFSARALSSLQGSNCNVKKLDEMLREKKLKVII